MLAKPPRVEGALRWDVAFLELGSGRALLRGEASGKREGVCRTFFAPALAAQNDQGSPSIIALTSFRKPMMTEVWRWRWWWSPCLWCLV